MALTLNSAAPRGVSKPYVNAPGANPTGAAAFTKAAQTFYPASYGGTPTTPAAAPAATTPAVTPPASTPFDYQTYLANDPILKQALSGLNASGVQNQGQLQAGQNRALVQRGLVPAGNLPGVSGIDATTAQLAAENTKAGTSSEAALRRAFQQTRQVSDNSLASRGLLRSGAYGQHAAEDLQGFTQAEYQTDQQLQDYLQGLYSGYLQQQQALQGQASTASNDALNRAIELIKAGLLGGSSPPPPPDDTAPPTTAQLSPGSTAQGSYNGVFSPANPTQYDAPSLTLPPLAAPKKTATRSRVAG